MPAARVIDAVYHYAAMRALWAMTGDIRSAKDAEAAMLRAFADEDAQALAYSAGMEATGASLMAEIAALRAEIAALRSDRDAALGRQIPSPPLPTRGKDGPP